MSKKKPTLTRREAKALAAAQPAKPESLEEQVRRLEREVAAATKLRDELEEENAILRKFSAFVATTKGEPESS